MSGPTRTLDLRLLTDAVRRRWVAMAIALTVVPLVGLGVRSFVRPKLKASSLVLVQESVQLNPVLKDLLVDVSVRSRLPAIQSIVMSSRTLESVLRRLGEISDATPGDEIAGRVESFRSQIDVYGEGGGVVRITVVGRWPNRVFDGCKLITDELVKEMIRPQTQALGESVTFLEAQLERVQSELAALEGKVRAFKDAHASALPEVYRLNLATYQDVVGSLVEAEADLAASEQRLKLFEEEFAAYDPLTSKAAERLKRARAKLRSLRETYTEVHPKVRAAEAEVSAAAAELKRAEARSDRQGGGRDRGTQGVASILGEGDRVERLSYQAIWSNTEALRQRVVFLRERSANLLAEIKSFADHEEELNSLTRNQATKSKVYGSLLERYEDAMVTRALAGYESSNKIQVIETPDKPHDTPQYSLSVVGLASLVGGLLLGLSLVLGIELFDRTVRLPREAEAIVGAPVLGTLPSFDV